MRLLIFLLLTFLVTWSAWFAAAGMAGPGNTGFFGVRGPVFLLGVFAPALVALALTAHDEGRAGATRLLARIGRWRVDARWYVFAISYFAVIKLGAAVVHRLVTGEWPRFGDTPVALMLLAIATSTWVQAGEELGWRGYALPRLATRFGLGGASLVIGAVWALWHLPLLVMLMHAAVNNTTGIVPAAIGGEIAPIALRGSLVAWATVGLSWAVAVPLLVRMRGADVQSFRRSEERGEGAKSER